MVGRGESDEGWIRQPTFQICLLGLQPGVNLTVGVTLTAVHLHKPFHQQACSHCGAEWIHQLNTMQKFVENCVQKEGVGRESMGRVGVGREGVGRESMGRVGVGREGVGRVGVGRVGVGRVGVGRESMGRVGVGRESMGRDSMGRCGGRVWGGVGGECGEGEYGEGQYGEVWGESMGVWGGRVWGERVEREGGVRCKPGYL